MENIIYEIEKEIAEAKYKQNNSMNLIRQINTIGEEKKNVKLLAEHTGKISYYDERLEDLEKRKNEYEQLLQEYLYH